jgi:Mn2+/Fe2+ NRAMP family transporter
VAQSHKMVHWLLNQPNVVMVVLLTPVVGVLGLFSALEMLIGSPLLYASVVAVVWCLWVRASGKKLKQV